MKKLITLFLAITMILSFVAVAEETVVSDATAITDAVTEPTTDATSEVATELSSDTVVATDATSETGADVESVVTDGLTNEGSEVTDAGTTPDSPLWGIERALERISVALTFDRAKKAEKRLMHARERLLEVSAMARKGNLKAATKAAEANAEDVEAAEGDLASEVEAKGETEQVKTLEARLDRHIAVLEKVAAKLQEKGVNAPGIANALAIAKAKQGLKLAKDAVKEARKSGGSVEEAKAKLQEAKSSFKETRSQIREKFVKKDSTEETTEEATEQPAEEISTETTEETLVETTEETPAKETSGTTSSA